MAQPTQKSTQPTRRKSGRQKATLSDVAQLSGVSASTVSRVLHGYTKGFSVKPNVRKAVLEAVEQLGYKANVAAQAVRSKRTGVVGVLGIQYDQEGVANPFDTQILHQLSQSLRKADLDLCHYFGSGLEEPYGLPDWPVDGFCVLNLCADEEYAAIEKSGLPYVSINGIAGPHGSSVTVDDAYGSKIAIDHLVELGHTRIAYIMESSWNMNHPSVDTRRRGYVDAMASHGLPPMPTWDQTYDMVQEAITEAYQRRCTALLVYSHFTAIVALNKAREIGLRIPQDMSIICFNNHFPVKHTTPRLTTIALPFKEMADAASSMLTKSISQRLAGGLNKVIKPELIVRESTVSPPQ